MAETTGTTLWSEVVLIKTSTSQILVAGDRVCDNAYGNGVDSSRILANWGYYNIQRNIRNPPLIYQYSNGPGVEARPQI